MDQSLLLNIIPFTPPVTQAAFPFYREYQEGYCPVYVDTDLKGLLDDKLTKLEQADIFWLYTDFGEPGEDAVIINIDLTVHIDLANHYYRYLIFNYFHKGIANVMHRNFIDDVEVWFINSEKKSDKYNVYNQFTLKVQHNGVTYGPELLVSYDGHTKVYKKSMAEMVGFPTETLNWMSCGGVLHRWSKIPDQWKLNLDNVYPVISNKMKPQLGIAFDLPDLTNRYPAYHNALSHFYTTYLDNETFRSILPIAQTGFVQLATDAVQQIDGEANLLQFGKDVGREPKTDLKRFGPRHPVPAPNNVKYFFIYQEADKALKEKLKTYFLEGYKYHPNMQEFIHQPFSFDETLDISFTAPEEAVRTVWDNIKNKVKNDQTKYLAIYISPIAKLDKDYERRRIYYRIKEMLLTEGYLSQVIFKNNITKDAFNYYLPNIQIAILAKLGGVPWTLKRDRSDELIIGIGAFYCHTSKTRYVGSLSCFNNEGVFKNSDCFGSQDTVSLAGSIREAVETFLKQNKRATRLIIHFYKLISKDELKPILNTLYNDLKLSIPVIIVTINKTASKELLAFDIDDPENLMPFSGTYVKVAERQYLLFNNTRYDENSKPTSKEYHFPVKIKFTSTELELLEDVTLIDLLIDQVYQFSRMYWKSVSQQNLPVTLAYPEMVAEMFPYFRYPKLPSFGEGKLWFL